MLVCMLGASILILFILYVNDIPDIIEGGVRMFADDTKIYSVIKNLTIASDCNMA